MPPSDITLSPTTTGENAPGTAMLARMAEQVSPRAVLSRGYAIVRSADGRVVVDAAGLVILTAAVPETLFESELFGHVKGAFTGAIASKKGLFEVADQGTIFFDEISTIGPETQAKLLRVIQEREFMRLGGTETIKADVRILVASNADLLALVREGRFREDLYHRLNVYPLHIPPLRERPAAAPRQSPAKYFPATL